MLAMRVWRPGMFLRGRGNNSSLREARSHASAACDTDHELVL